jgi:hypothetical protein
MSRLIKKIVSMVDLPSIKPNYFLEIFVSFFKMMFDHSLPKLYGMTHELNSSIISTILNIFLFLKIDTNMLLLYSSNILLYRKMILNSLVSHIIATSPRHLHTSIGMSSDSNVLSVFIIFKASFTSDS